MTTAADRPGPLTPSPSLWKLRRTEVSVVTLLLAAVLGLSIGSGAGAPGGVIAVAATCAVGVLALVVARRRFKAWSYEERDEDLLVSRGVMFRRQSVVPYGRMQFIDVTAGPIERSYRLSTVQLHTAAAASDARIPGLPREEAARLRDRLTTLGEAQAAGL